MSDVVPKKAIYLALSIESLVDVFLPDRRYNRFTCNLFGQYCKWKSVRINFRLVQLTCRQLCDERDNDGSVSEHCRRNGR